MGILEKGIILDEISFGKLFCKSVDIGYDTICAYPKGGCFVLLICFFDGAMYGFCVCVVVLQYIAQNVLGVRISIENLFFYLV